MATKNSDTSFKGKDFVGNSLSSTSSNRDQQYTNLNLNHNHGCSDLQLVQSKSTKSNGKNETANDFSGGNNYKSASNNNFSTKSHSQSLLSKDLNHEAAEDFQKKNKQNESSNLNKITLSLHIAAYENSIETAGDNGIDKENAEKRKSKTNGFWKKRKNAKEDFTGTSMMSQNYFEIPRQQKEAESAAAEPEVMQFKASQKLLDPNQKESKEEESQIVVREPVANVIVPEPVANLPVPVANVPVPVANVPVPVANVPEPVANVIVPEPVANLPVPVANVPVPVANVPVPVANVPEPVANVNLPRSIVNREDILVDVFAELLSGAIIDENFDSLQRFMLSGREPFQAGLDFFSRLRPEGISIESTNVSINFVFILPYNFPGLLDVIALPSIKALEIKSFPESAAGQRVLANLNHEGLKNVAFGDMSKFDNSLFGAFLPPPGPEEFYDREDKYKLPADYVDLLKNKCNCDSIIYDGSCAENPTVTDILAMNSARHVIFIDFTKVVDALAQVEEGTTFPGVRDLYFLCPSMVSCSIDKVHTFILGLPLHMPNLTTIDASACWKFEDWFDTFQGMVEFHPGMFNFIPLEVKGKIAFCVSGSYMEYEDIVEKIGDNVGIVVKQKTSKCKVVKKFEIHDGLSFKFKISFVKPQQVGCSIL